MSDHETNHPMGDGEPPATPMRHEFLDRPHADVRRDLRAATEEIQRLRADLQGETARADRAEADLSAARAANAELAGEVRELQLGEKIRQHLAAHGGVRRREIDRIAAGGAEGAREGR